MEAGQTCHSVHVLGGGVNIAVLQVVEDGVVKENCVLQQQQCRRRGRRKGRGVQGRGSRGRGIKVRLQRIFLFFFFFNCCRKHRLQTKAMVGGRKRHNANDKNTVLAPSVQITLSTLRKKKREKNIYALLFRMLLLFDCSVLLACCSLLANWITNKYNHRRNNNNKY